MKKTLWSKIICITMIFTLSVFLLPNNKFIIKDVYADEVQPGDRIDAPDPTVHKQFNGITEGQLAVENYWLYDCAKLYNIWKDNGWKTTEDDLCYITVGGTDYIYVAVAPIFGKPGDYLKVHVNHEGEEKDYYMIVFDIKGPYGAGEDYMNYWIKDGKKVSYGGDIGATLYGHSCTYTWDVLNILEFPYNGSMDKTYNFTKNLVNVEYIINGGSYFENPDGPIGFDGSSSGPDTEYDTFIGACGHFLGNFGTL